MSLKPTGILLLYFRFTPCVSKHPVDSIMDKNISKESTIKLNSTNVFFSFTYTLTIGSDKMERNLKRIYHYSKQRLILE